MLRIYENMTCFLYPIFSSRVEGNIFFLKAKNLFPPCEGRRVVPKKIS